jgi:hypothetical protein
VNIKQVKQKIQDIMFDGSVEMAETLEKIVIPFIDEQEYRLATYAEGWKVSSKTVSNLIELYGQVEKERDLAVAMLNACCENCIGKDECKQNKECEVDGILTNWKWEGVKNGNADSHETRKEKNAGKMRRKEQEC